MVVDLVAFVTPFMVHVCEKTAQPQCMVRMRSSVAVEEMAKGQRGGGIVCGHCRGLEQARRWRRRVTALVLVRLAQNPMEERCRRRMDWRIISGSWPTFETWTTIVVPF